MYSPITPCSSLFISYSSGVGPINYCLSHPVLSIVANFEVLQIEVIDCMLHVPELSHHFNHML